MVKRTLLFENPSKLFVRDEQLVIQMVNNDGIPENIKSVTIPVEDIGVFVLDNKQITLTHALLNHLVSSNAAVITCDDRHMPSSLFMPLEGNSVQHERFMAQLDASIPLRKQLWQQTIQAKIRNQAAMLKRQGHEVANMLQWLSDVKSGDAENHEARASAFYWSRIFSGHIVQFRRARDGQAPNNLLNYGYAILRAITARSLVASGLLPTLGIHHRNRYNAYCLADDIMEPYRPFVDQVVLDIVKERMEIEKITTGLKRRMLSIPVTDVILDNMTSPLMVAMLRTTSSLSACFAGETRKILYPTVG